MYLLNLAILTLLQIFIMVFNLFNQYIQSVHLYNSFSFDFIIIIMTDPIYLNSDSQCYLNSSLKSHALKIKIHKYFLSKIMQIQFQCSKCQNIECINQKLLQNEQLKQKVKRFNSLLNDLQFQKDNNLILCEELVEYNDVKLCRKGVREKYVQKVVSLGNSELTP